MKNLFFITIPTMVILLLIFELFFRFFFPAAHYPIRYFDEEVGILKFNQEFGETGVVSLGKFGQEQYQWTINNHGWNSSIDYVHEKGEKTRIAIIGDSYIEAFQVNSKDHLSRKLDQLLGENIEVYSFGVSGSPLSQYLHMARYVEETYQPDVMIVNVVYNDFDESLHEWILRKSFMSLEIEEGKPIQEIAPVKDPINKLAFLKNSAFASYLLYNLKVRETFRDFLNSQKDRSTINANIYLDQLGNEKVYQGMDYVVEQFKQDFPNTKVVFMMDAPREDIYKGKLSDSNVLFLEHRFKESCTKNGLAFIPLSPLFEADYQTNAKKFNSPYDGHWNPYAHDLIANHLFDFLKNDTLVKKEMNITDLQIKKGELNISDL